METPAPPLYKRDTVIFLLILMLIVAIWKAGWYWVDSQTIPNSKDEVGLTIAAVRGQFGDKFGAVNTLFSAFAFAGIIFTILLQRRDLIETRNAMSHERFDNTFFQLLSLHMDITEKISARAAMGLDAFAAFNEYLRLCDRDFPVFCALQKIPRDRVRPIIDAKLVDTALNPELDEADIANLRQALTVGTSSLENFLDENIAMHEKKIVDAYTKSCSQYLDRFSHYFRNLYHILKFIDSSSLISRSEKKNYAKFVRSQLSDVELVVIFYNSIAKIELPGRETMELGFPKMGRLLQKYDVLQNMSPRSLIHPKHMMIFLKNNGQPHVD